MLHRRVAPILVLPDLRRIGFVPDVKIEPPIAGTRAGRDEVLDRAIAYVDSIAR